MIEDGAYEALQNLSGGRTLFAVFAPVTITIEVDKVEMHG